MREESYTPSPLPKLPKKLLPCIRGNFRVLFEFQMESSVFGEFTVLCMDTDSAGGRYLMNPMNAKENPMLERLSKVVKESILEAGTQLNALQGASAPKTEMTYTNDENKVWSIKMTFGWQERNMSQARFMEIAERAISALDQEYPDCLDAMLAAERPFHAHWDLSTSE